MRYFKKTMILISVMIFLMPPSVVYAHQIGEYIPLTASVSAETLTGSGKSVNEEYQFEGSNTADRNIHSSGSDLIGYGESRYPVTVAFAGGITDISQADFPDIRQFEQELLIDGSEISRLFQSYRTGNAAPEEWTQFESDWQRVVNGYADVLGRLTDGVNLRELAEKRLSGIRLADILAGIPELTVTGGLTVRVDTNTDPDGPKDRPADIFALMAEIGMKNWEEARKAADDAKALISGRAYAGTQIVGRPDLYAKSTCSGDSSFNYEENVLTIYVMSRGSMSSYGGQSLSSGWSWNEETGQGETNIISFTSDARAAGMDTYGKALEAYRIPATADNIARLKSLYEDLKDMSSGNNWFSLSYMKALTAIADHFPEYDRPSAWDEFSRAEAEKEESDPHGEHGHYMADIKLEFPETRGLVTDYDLSDSTAVTFDAAVHLLMGSAAGDADNGESGSASPPDPQGDEVNRRDALTDEYISKYVTGAGYECLSQSELTSLYPHDAYTPNEEVYSIDGKYTGTLGGAVRLITGDIPVYNRITGSAEKIAHASESTYDYICFCAGTNGWVRIKDGRGDVRFIRYDDFIHAANAAAAEHGYGPDLVSDCYMVCAGENHDKGHALELRLDTSQIASSVFQQLTVNDMRELLGDHEIALRELLDFSAEGYGSGTAGSSLPDGFFRDLGLTEDWWKDILRNILRDADRNGLPDGSDSPDGQADADGSETGGLPIAEASGQGSPRFSMEDFIRWLTEQGYITKQEGKKHTEADEIRWMTEYFPEYLTHYNGVMVFSVDRIITKQLKNTASRSTSRVQNVGYPEHGGSHKWVVTTNGFSALPYYCGSESGVTLAAGTTSVSASERVRRVYEDSVTYDYTEEWILEPLGIVIYRKTVSGHLAGADGQDHDVNTVSFSTTLGPLTEIPAGSWTFVTDVDEFGQVIQQGEPGAVSFGTVTVYSIGGGYWINGIPSADYSTSRTSLFPADSSAYCYRIQ